MEFRRARATDKILPVQLRRFTQSVSWQLFVCIDKSLPAAPSREGAGREGRRGGHGCGGRRRTDGAARMYFCGRARCRESARARAGADARQNPDEKAGKFTSADVIAFISGRSSERAGVCARRVRGRQLAGVESDQLPGPQTRRRRPATPVRCPAPLTDRLTRPAAASNGRACQPAAAATNEPGRKLASHTHTRTTQR